MFTKKKLLTCFTGEAKPSEWYLPIATITLKLKYQNKLFCKSTETCFSQKKLFSCIEKNVCCAT